MESNLKSTLAIIAGVTLGCELLYFIYKSFKNKHVNVSRKSVTVNKVKPNHVIFFNGNVCSSSPENCAISSCSHFKLMTFISIIEKCKETLDVCIYLLTSFDITNGILSAHQKGARVRMIVDMGMSDNSGSQVSRLRKFGVPIRMKKSPHIMHHKFLIIDRQILATGSCNWTQQAINCNWENIIIIHDKNIVDSFLAEFNNMWTDFGSSTFKSNA